MNGRRPLCLNAPSSNRFQNRKFESSIFDSRYSILIPRLRDYPQINSPDPLEGDSDGNMRSILRSPAGTHRDRRRQSRGLRDERLCGAITARFDPCDVLIANTRAIAPGAILSVRPVGVLIMEDNAGEDEKIIAVPSRHTTARYDRIENYTDLPDITVMQIEHFLSHYKDLEPGKWVKIKR
jgi:hypothetical protein